MDVKENTSSDWMIEEDTPAEQLNAAPAPPPWRVLIVDDDVDVHVVTKFSLSNACFMGRRLSFLHAYSAGEALAILRNTPDIALVLLDVIMETSEAGLKLARQIREELGNKLVRIVLRTGQPGQALEHSIILDYDINDFWCKTDLTTRKLFTTVISSLRGYASLEEAARRYATLSATLAESAVFTLDQNSRILEANPKAAELLRTTPEALAGREFRAVKHAPSAEEIQQNHWIRIQ